MALRNPDLALQTVQEIGGSLLDGDKLTPTGQKALEIIDRECSELVEAFKQQRELGDMIVALSTEALKTASADLVRLRAEIVDLQRRITALTGNPEVAELLREANARG